MHDLDDSVCREQLAAAYRSAMISSDDPHTQVGAVLIINGTQVRAANSIPWNGPYEPELFERPQKYKNIEHAERLVIFKAAKLGLSTLGATMYAPWACCCECARAIIAAGIKKVIVHKECMDKTPEKWKEEIAQAIRMLQKAEIQHLAWSGNIGRLRNLFNEEYWEP